MTTKISSENVKPEAVNDMTSLKWQKQTIVNAEFYIQWK